MRTEPKLPSLGIGYQTQMQMKLTEGLDHSLERRLEKLEKAVKIKVG
jgi:hypothetical protein